MPFPDLAALAGHDFDDVDGNGLTHRQWMASVGALATTVIVVNDADVTVGPTAGNTVVLYNSVTAARVVNLPPASSEPMIITVKDVNAQATNRHSISIQTSGSDTAPDAVVSIGQPVGNTIGGMMSWVNDGVSAWALIGENYYEGDALEEAQTVTGRVANLIGQVSGVSSPSGGTVIDVEARAALLAIQTAIQSA